MVTAKIVNTHQILKFNQCIDKLRKHLPEELEEFQLTYEHMLEESASQVHTELLRIGLVLDVRWAASQPVCCSAISPMCVLKRKYMLTQKYRTVSCWMLQKRGNLGTIIK